MASRSAGLNVVIAGDAKGFAKATGDARQHLDKLGKQTTLTARVTQRGFSGIGLAAKGAAAATVGLTAGVGFLVKQYEESAKVAKQTNAVLKSTGGAANVTAKEVANLAGAISRKTGVDDEAIQSGENLLLTFTNIRNEAGKGNDIFTQSTRILTDMSVALGQDTKNSAIQLGKALNDPIKGVTALQRVGVSFTAQQKDQIKTLVDSGKKLDAQRLILHELNKEFGGSAAAQATPFDKLKVSAGNLAETVGGLLAPALETGASWLNRFLNQATSGKGPIGGLLASIADLPGKLTSQFNKLKDEKGGAGAAIGAMILNGINSIDWNAVGRSVSEGFRKALKIGAAIVGGIGQALDQVDWGALGRKVSDGFTAAIDLVAPMRSAIAGGIKQAASSIDGRALAGGLLKVVGEALNALSDPTFWAEHWKDVLTVAVAIIPVGKILRLPGLKQVADFLGRWAVAGIRGALGVIANAFGRIGQVGGLRALEEIEKVAPRFANAVLSLVTGGARELGKMPGRFFQIVKNAGVRVLDAIGNALGGIVGGIARWVIQGDRKLGEAGDKFFRRGVEAGKAVLRALNQALGGIPGAIAGAVFNIGKAIVDGIVKGIRSAPGRIGNAVKGVIGGAAGAVTGFLKDHNPFGDGVGKELAGSGLFAPKIGGFPSSLHGANSALSPFAAAGARFGLHLTAGRNDHSTFTTSGNVSYHSTGEAIDMSNGYETPQEMAFFKFMASNYGSRLAELIYTPAGYSIKNGQRVPPIAASDHHDHVHVAVDLGKPGPGIGDGTGKRRRFTGDGIGQTIAAARAAGFRGQALVNMVAIAGAESGFNPRRENLTPPDHSIGLWQINQLAHHGRFGSDQQLMDPVRNARAAAELFRERGYAPWTTWPAAAKAYIPRALKAVTGSRTGSVSASAGVQARSGPVIGDLGIVSGGWSGGMEPRAGGLQGAFGAPSVIAGAEAATNLAVARFGADDPRANPARERQRAAIRDRITIVKQHLRKRGLSPAQRVRWTNELAELITTGRQLGDDIQAAIPTPPSFDTFADAAIANAQVTPDLHDDLAVANSVASHAESQYKKALASGDPEKIRDAANAFVAARDAVKGLTDQITPTADDFDRMNTATAALTDTLDDDLDVATKIATRRQDEYNAALATGDPKKIAEAAENLKAATDNVKGITETIRQATPTPQDYNDLATAMAGLTDSVDDDKAAAEERVRIGEDMLKQAQNTPGIQDDIDAANFLKGARDQLKSINDSIDQGNEDQRRRDELIQANTDAQRAVADELKRTNDIATATGSTELFQIKKWITDTAANGLGAATQSRGRTPGSGVAVAY